MPPGKVSFGTGWPLALGLIDLGVIISPILDFGTARYAGPAVA
jgi:hypothetical protein